MHIIGGDGATGRFFIVNTDREIELYFRAFATRWSGHGDLLTNS